MLFTSLEFLLAFLPLVLLVNFLLPCWARNYWLLLASLFFYAWGEPEFVLIMLGSILINYLLALAIGVSRNHAANPVYAGVGKAMLVLALVQNLGILFVYKYMNFTSSLISEAMPGLNIAVSNFVLPIGISFFTFQALSYVIDVYRGIPAQRNIVNVALYISLFPQLVAGPIVRYTTVAKELLKRHVTADSFSTGVQRFLLGFNKKMLLANVFAKIADAAFAAQELSVGMAWLGGISYSLQIFFDFAGYSEMAIGIGLMLGFSFLENFNYPYISRTLTEFWRRWHISLGTWFRDYLYFPLGGSRGTSKLKMVFNLSFVWLITGIWHGANGTFILWGILHGFFVILEKLFAIPRLIDKHWLLSLPYRVITLLIVLLGWVLFRADSIDAAKYFIQTMFFMNGAQLIDGAFAFNMGQYRVFLLIGLVCATPIFQRISAVAESGDGLLANVYRLCFWLLQLLLFLAGISSIVMNDYNPFIYFNF